MIKVDVKVHLEHRSVVLKIDGKRFEGSAEQAMELATQLLAAAKSLDRRQFWKQWYADRYEVFR